MDALEEARSRTRARTVARRLLTEEQADATGDDGGATATELEDIAVG